MLFPYETQFDETGRSEIGSAGARLFLATNPDDPDCKPADCKPDQAETKQNARARCTVELRGRTAKFGASATEHAIIA
ncbi:hypothetical protein [Burkholderia sp. L27(2015)]|uniref:hypothetical protein n=1 Tax=Burkholderia sp. L27(2015) TaxID=1641858 RepID=UPI00131A6A8B|nr:hypothetical protein [Burkholderia sp. L27(2015)]